MDVTVRRNSDGIFPVKLWYKLYDDCQNGDYPAKLVISGEDEAIPFVIHIRYGQEPQQKPNVEMKLLTSELIVGQNGQCILQITNRSSSLELTYCILHFSDSTGDLLPTPSDTISLESIFPGQSLTVSLSISVSAGAKVANYQLQAELSFESLTGEGSWKEMLTVPVRQEMRLDHGEVVTGGSVIQGNSGAISVEIMNLGAGDVKNIRMVLNLGEFVRDQTVLVGNLQSGNSATGKLSFGTTNATIGTAEGELTVVYEDTFGNEESFTQHVSIVIEEPKATIAAPEDSSESKVPGYTWVLIAVCGVLVAVLIIQSILLHNKIHKLEEDKL